MRLEDLNPLAKAATILACAVLLSFQYNAALNLTVFLCALLLLAFFSRAKWGWVLRLLIPAIIAAVGLFMMGLYYAREDGARTALQLAARLLAYAGLGMTFALSTGTEDFVLSLIHQGHLPARFAYGILAAFHLIPILAREFRTVRTAFQVRGLPVGALSRRPLFTMLVNGVLWSESVAMAMESKGFSGEDRTYYSIPRVGMRDVLFAAACIGSIIGGMVSFGQ